MGVSTRQYYRYERNESPLPAHRIAALYAHTQEHVSARLPANEAGRDFVVGDLHGHGDALQQFLVAQNFCPESDRVFSTGDLIDRGPDSLATLRLLYEPWFYAVRGNHEDMLLDFCTGQALYGHPDNSHPLLHNGGEWITRLCPDEQDELWYGLVPRVALLPHILIIGNGPKRFHVVHAELDGPKGRVTDALVDRLAQEPDQSLLPLEYIPGFGDKDRWRIRLLWGRGLIRSEGNTALLPGLSPTFVGHSFVPYVTQRLSHVFVDTGAASITTGSDSAHITVIEIPHADVASAFATAIRSKPVPAETARDSGGV
ncbi:MAG TPA: metallophosphoesterase [Acidiferrobacter sp.]|nr:metallophosphoesterase [Acidiferrobacter sp.]